MTMPQDTVQAFRARALGSAASDIDLAIDLSDRPACVTALLAACLSGEQGQPIDVEHVWDWTLNQRLQALLAMRLASEGDEHIDLHARCAGCGEAMEIALPLRGFLGEPVPARFTWHSPEGLALRLRLPRGRDLQAWGNDSLASPESLAGNLIEGVSGVPEGGAQPPLVSLLSALDDAFEAHDPLTALRLQTTCPSCGHDQDVACDLEAMLLDGFARDHTRLLDDVLALAAAFHWSEAEILALPRWRRDHYLRQLAQGDGL